MYVTQASIYTLEPFGALATESGSHFPNFKSQFFFTSKLIKNKRPKGLNGYLNIMFFVHVSAV